MKSDSSQDHLSNSSANGNYVYKRAGKPNAYKFGIILILLLVLYGLWFGFKNIILHEESLEKKLAKEWHQTPWEEGEKLIKEGKYPAPQKVLEVQLAYDLKSTPIILVKKERILNGFPQRILPDKEQYTIEAIDAQDTLVSSLKFNLPTLEFHDVWGALEEQSQVKLNEKGTFVVKLAYGSIVKRLQIKDQNGLVITTKILDSVEEVNNKPNFHTKLSTVGKKSSMYDKLTTKVSAQTPVQRKMHTLIMPFKYGGNTDKFHLDLSRFIVHLQLYEPYRTRWNQLAFSEITYENNYGCSRIDPNQGRFSNCNWQQIVQTANNSGLIWDTIVVLVNDSREPPAGTGVPDLSAAVAYVGNLGPRVAVHEMGHGFAKLWDEYVADVNPAYYPAADRINRNCYQQSPTRDLWSGTRLSEYVQECEVAHWWRSSFDSVMRGGRAADQNSKFNTASKIYINEALDYYTQLYLVALEATIAPTPTSGYRCESSKGTCGCVGECRDGTNQDFRCCRRVFSGCMDTNVKACITVFDPNGGQNHECADNTSEPCTYASPTPSPVPACPDPEDGLKTPIASCDTKGNISASAQTAFYIDEVGFFVDEITPSGNISVCRFSSVDDGNTHQRWQGRACGTMYYNSSSGQVYKLGQPLDGGVVYFNTNDLRRGHYTFNVSLKNVRGGTCEYLASCQQNVGTLHKINSGCENQNASTYDYAIVNPTYKCVGSQIYFKFGVKKIANTTSSAQVDVRMGYPHEERGQFYGGGNHYGHSPKDLCAVYGNPVKSEEYYYTFSQSTGETDRNSSKTQYNVCLLRPDYAFTQPGSNSFNFASGSNPVGYTENFTFIGETRSSTFKGTLGKKYRVSLTAQKISGGCGDKENLYVTCPLPPTPTPLPATPTPGPNKYNISGKIYIDRNNNGVIDASDVPFTRETAFSIDQALNVNLTLSSGQTQSYFDDAYGTYYFSDIPQGVYTLTLATPSRFKIVVNSSQTITLDRHLTDINFLVQGYTVSIYTYIDYNKNGVFDCASQCDVPISLQPVTISGGYVTRQETLDANGKYTFYGIAAGSYAVTPSYPTGSGGYIALNPEQLSIVLSSTVPSVQINLRLFPYPDNYEPKGSFDLANCQEVTGWSCDLDDPNSANDVHISSDYYQDPASDWHWTALGTIKANLPREQAVANECGGNPNHGFRFPVPSSVKDNTPHTIYVRIGNLPEDRYVATGPGYPIPYTWPPQGKTITCAPTPSSTPTPTPRPTNTPIPTSSATPTISSADNTPPLITITSPASGTVYTAIQKTTTINAKASDASGVAEIKIYIDNIEKKSCLNPASWFVCSYYWDTLGTAGVGIHTIKVTARDKAIPVPNTAVKSITVTKK